ncbi:MAG: M48 family metalloprotease [Acidobacteria bacterium]|nr:M48 family metalloprotease [Acidobacteriota bacterium]
MRDNKRFWALLAFTIAGLALTGRAQDKLELASVTLNAKSVVGGNQVQGMVTLTRAAEDDIEVSLAADPPDAASLPKQVLVTKGSTSAAFTITTAVSKLSVGGEDAVIGIYANYQVTKHASFTILAPVGFDSMVDRVIQREHLFVEAMKAMHPLVETYIQNIREDKEHNLAPTGDTYFLGRGDFSGIPEEAVFKQQTASAGHLVSPFKTIASLFQTRYLPNGFAQMALVDRDFSKHNYYFEYVRQEFLGEVRCIVVDVRPREKAPKGLFEGRIWVEDRDFNIVRFNGVYTRNSRYKQYLHFDSWRSNLKPGVWLPAYIYSEETDPEHDHPGVPMFKSQTRLWGYDVEGLKHSSEMTAMQVDGVVEASEGAMDSGPVESARLWERMAEDNALDYLQKVGLLAPAGEVDKVLQTVVNNLIITNKLDIVPEVRVRILLTTPLESFTIGHTIVLSRGLIDVLPDEASLAMMLSHELAHIALGHKLNTKFAFTDRFFFPDPATFERIDFSRSNLDESAADRKALELLNSSPYKDKLATAGLFLRELEEQAPVLTNLIRPHLGNPLGSKQNTRLNKLNAAAPPLQDKNIMQMAALPLGSRIKVDAWSNHLSLLNVKPVALLSAEEKMPFKVTPFNLYLKRLPDQEMVGHSWQPALEKDREEVVR